MEALIGGDAARRPRTPLKLGGLMRLCRGVVFAGERKAYSEKKPQKSFYWLR
jgi:hypothetical protein